MILELGLRYLLGDKKEEGDIFFLLFYFLKFTLKFFKHDPLKLFMLMNHIQFVLISFTLFNVSVIFPYLRRKREKGEEVDKFLLLFFFPINSH